MYLRDNKLEKLHSSLGKCTKLETINVEDNCLSKIGKKVVELQNLKYFLLANNKLTKLPFNPHQTSRGLRRLTLRGNQLDMSTLQLDTDVQEEQKKSGDAAGSKTGTSKSNEEAKSGGEKKTEEAKESKMEAIGEGDDDEETSGDEDDDGGL